MISKSIHYCWFGKKPLSKIAEKCIESWRRYCPDYEIKEWNESNFDINCNTYVREAYEAKKYAFVADYARLYILYTYGGIYMDTDVEVIRSLDDFLVNRAFAGFEADRWVSTGTMACEKGFPLFKDLLAYYEDRTFIKPNHSFDMLSNVNIITNILGKKGFLCNNKSQVVEGLRIYPTDYFCPKSFETYEIKLTENTVCIHHFEGSWLPQSEKKELMRMAWCRRYYGRFASIGFKFHHFILRPWNIIRWIRK